MRSSARRGPEARHRTTPHLFICPVHLGWLSWRHRSVARRRTSGPQSSPLWNIPPPPPMRTVKGLGRVGWGRSCTLQLRKCGTPPPTDGESGRKAYLGLTVLGSSRSSHMRAEEGRSSKYWWQWTPTRPWAVGNDSPLPVGSHSRPWFPTPRVPYPPGSEVSERLYRFVQPNRCPAPHLFSFILGQKSW